MSEAGVGPLITVATFCEKILDEKDDVPSLIRLVDRISFTRPPDVFAAKGEPVTPIVELAFFLRLTARGLQSTHELRLAFQTPDNEEKEMVKHSFTFDPKRSGMNIKANIAIGIKVGGFCWLKVYLDDVLLTQVPLEIVEIGTSESG